MKKQDNLSKPESVKGPNRLKSNTNANSNTRAQEPTNIKPASNRNDTNKSKPSNKRTDLELPISKKSVTNDSDRLSKTSKSSPGRTSNKSHEKNSVKVTINSDFTKKAKPMQAKNNHNNNFEGGWDNLNVPVTDKFDSIVQYQAFGGNDDFPVDTIEIMQDFSKRPGPKPIDKKKLNFDFAGERMKDTSPRDTTKVGEKKEPEHLIEQVEFTQNFNKGADIIQEDMGDFQFDFPKAPQHKIGKNKNSTLPLEMKVKPKPLNETPQYDAKIPDKDKVNDQNVKVDLKNSLHQKDQPHKVDTGKIKPSEHIQHNNNTKPLANGVNNNINKNESQKDSKQNDPLKTTTVIPKTESKDVKQLPVDSRIELKEKNENYIMQVPRSLSVTMKTDKLNVPELVNVDRKFLASTLVSEFSGNTPTQVTITELRSDIAHRLFANANKMHFYRENPNLSKYSYSNLNYPVNVVTHVEQKDAKQNPRLLYPSKTQPDLGFSQLNKTAPSVFVDSKKSTNIPKNQVQTQPSLNMNDRPVPPKVDNRSKAVTEPQNNNQTSNRKVNQTVVLNSEKNKINDSGNANTGTIQEQKRNFMTSVLKGNKK